MFSAKNIVRKSVMKVVDNRIKEGEKKLEEGCRNIDEEHFRNVVALEATRERNKQRLLDGIVSDILTKNL
jgi:hypothetical protein